MIIVCGWVARSAGAEENRAPVFNSCIADDVAVQACAAVARRSQLTTDVPVGSHCALRARAIDGLAPRVIAQRASKAGTRIGNLTTLTHVLRLTGHRDAEVGFVEIEAKFARHVRYVEEVRARSSWHAATGLVHVVLAETVGTEGARNRGEAVGASEIAARHGLVATQVHVTFKHAVHAVAEMSGGVERHCAQRAAQILTAQRLLAAHSQVPAILTCGTSAICVHI
mmetsp:Transcript_115989/g.314916  ORF Transcript_115989/g.314916 Transcript_115989/m.314916 type:complete len:226 (-) Transcript_115989:240-917(-)